jgi:hypothetical protein
MVRAVVPVGRAGIIGSIGSSNGATSSSSCSGSDSYGSYHHHSLSARWQSGMACYISQRSELYCEHMTAAIAAVLCGVQMLLLLLVHVYPCSVCC